MPLYDYQCKSCQRVTEVRHGFRETFTGPCPDCGSSDVGRVFSAAPIIFNGSGFYVTDSRPKAADSSGKESGSKESGSKESGTKSDAGGKSSTSNAA